VRAGSGEPLLHWLRVQEALERLDAAIGLEQPAAMWCDLAGWLAGQLLAGDHPWRDSLQRYHDALTRLREGCAHEPSVLLDAAGFEQALSQALDGAAQAAMPGSAVTVCPLGGLRGIPWRVVVLFGMDEGAWPRAAARGEFDLLARSPRFGDRLARTDDRGVFLEALLACDERLLMIYQGRDARDDAVLNPSPVVAELFRLSVPAMSAYLGVRLIRQQPVHRFSMASFRGERPTYDADWLAAAQALTRPLAGRAEGTPRRRSGRRSARPSGRRSWRRSGADPAPIGAGSPVALDLSIADLSAALADPQRHWWTARFGLRLPYQPLALAEIEPLGEPLARDATLLAGLVEGLARGRSEDDLVRETALLPALASGTTGRYQARLLVAAARRLLAPVSVFLRPPPAKAGARAAAAPPQVDPGTLERMAACCQCIALEARIDGVRMFGEALLFPALGLQLVVGAYRLGARTLIDAWLAHALWSCALPASGPRTTLALADDGWVSVEGDGGPTRWPMRWRSAAPPRAAAAAPFSASLAGCPQGRIRFAKAGGCRGGAGRRRAVAARRAVVPALGAGVLSGFGTRSVGGASCQS
jgi:hypothetical protein